MISSRIFLIITKITTLTQKTCYAKVLDKQLCIHGTKEVIGVKILEAFKDLPLKKCNSQ